MEVLLSFVLCVQVGLSVFAVMKYLEAMAALQAKSDELVACMTDLVEIETASKNYHTQTIDIQKDIATIKSKLSFGVSK